MKQIQIINETLSEVIIDDDYVAYKDEKVFPVWVSKGLFRFGSMLGRFKFVLDENDQVLATAYPMSTLNSGYELISKEKIQWYKKIVAAYDK